MKYNKISYTFFELNCSYNRKLYFCDKKNF